MYGLPPLQRYCDERYMDRSRNAGIRSDLNGPFYTGLHQKRSQLRKSSTTHFTLSNIPRWRRCLGNQPGSWCWVDQTLARMRSSSRQACSYLATIELDRCRQKRGLGFVDWLETSGRVTGSLDAHEDLPAINAPRVEQGVHNLCLRIHS